MKRIICDNCLGDMTAEPIKHLHFEHGKIHLSVNVYKMQINKSEGMGWEVTEDLCDLCINETIRKTYEGK